MNKNLEYLIKRYQEFPEVDAICLGGSRARSANLNDDASDYDVYIYLNKPLSKEKRIEVLEKITCYREIDNGFFEPEDDVIMNDNIPLELIYRRIADFEEMIKKVMIDCVPQAGYTTCFVDNMLNSIVLFERNNVYTNFRNKYSFQYPTRLKENIIKLNRDYLSGTMASFDGQIIKAYKRGDVVSINHRTCEFVKCYFDILFALNETYHIGEKRLLSYALNNFKVLPKDFEKNLNMLLSQPDDIESLLREIIDNLDELI